VNLSDQPLPQALRRCGISITDTEFITAAFISAREFTTWDTWLTHANTQFGPSAHATLQQAAAFLLKRDPDAEEFSVGFITPERPATESLDHAIAVPRSFVEFLSNSRLSS
jgi:hypothetical protein